MLFSKKRIVAAAGALAIAGGLAFAAVGPAAAQTCSVANCANVSATVNQAVTISGIRDVTFPAANAGATTSVTGAESFTVTSNDAKGYVLSAKSGADSFTPPTGGTAISDNPNWIISETGFAAGFSYSPGMFGSTGATDSGPTQGDAYTENWSLAIPAGAVPGSYDNTLTYLVTGN